MRNKRTFGATVVAVALVAATAALVVGPGSAGAQPPAGFVTVPADDFRLIFRLAEVPPPGDGCSVHGYISLEPDERIAQYRIEINSPNMVVPFVTTFDPDNPNDDFEGTVWDYDEPDPDRIAHRWAGAGGDGPGNNAQDCVTTDIVNWAGQWSIGDSSGRFASCFSRTATDIAPAGGGALAVGDGAVVIGSDQRDVITHTGPGTGLGIFVCSFGGNDSVTGSPQADFIDLGDGADTASGRGGRDEIDGGKGADTIRGGSGGDFIDGGAAGDTLIGGSGRDQIRGKSGADTIRGNSGRDDIRGGSGADVLSGGSGADLIRGGGGRDNIVGQRGADTLDGGLGSDTIRGGSGRDDIEGGQGRDFLFGNSGNDTLNGGTGADLLNGGRGTDRCFGNARDTFRRCE